MIPRYFILTYFLLAVLLAPVLILSGAPWTLLGVWGGVLLLFLYPALRCNCSWFGPIVTCFPTNKREVWLTIDDGPDPIDTPQILELLEEYQARATFFLIGERATRYPKLVREIVRRGHSLGNHTQTHPVANFWMIAPFRLAREVDTCAAAVTASGVAAPLLFRAPVGMANFFILPMLRRRGLSLVGWSARGLDGIHTDPEQIVDRIWSGVRPGAVILLHEGFRSQGRESASPRCLALLLERLSAAGYSCILPSVPSHGGTLGGKEQEVLTPLVEEPLEVLN